MGKYSDFERVPRDFYETPMEAVAPLAKHIAGINRFCEPCAGAGKLINNLESLGMSCVKAYDIHPLTNRAEQLDIFDLTKDHLVGCDAVITNPPWDRKFLHPMISHMLSLDVQTWLLFDADWAHTKQSSYLIKNCSDIVSVGRVKWIPDSKYTGKENCAWYRFVNDNSKTRFHGRSDICK